LYKEEDMTTRRAKRHAGRRSRKAGATTVEGLHASFDKIDAKVADMIARGKTDSDLACCIKKEWSEQFHMGLSMPAIKGMVQHYRAMHKGSPKGRRTRKQVGGMAPMDWTMGQGNFDKTYGEFPAPISGLSWAAFDQNRFAESPSGRSANPTGGHSVQMGGATKTGGGSKKQKGGGIFDALGMGTPLASVPPNAIQTATYALQGSTRSMEPSSSPITSQPYQATYTPKAYEASDLSSIAAIKSIYTPI